MFIAEYYQKDDGTYPVEEFILSLDNKMKAKVLWTISLLEEYGTKLRLPYSEHLEDDISSSGSNRVRISPESCISSTRIKGSFSQTAS